MKRMICLLLLLKVASGFAQDNNPHNNFTVPQIIPKSPNTAMIDKFGDYQVNLFSGLPDISIPIYTIKTKDFEIPITLSYHASGLKVTEFPSWVGLGWGLDAGGQVSRSVVGSPDERTYSGFLHGSVKNYTSLNIHSNSGRDYLRDQADGNKDSGADIFSYSFPGGSGKFFFGMIDSTHYKPVLMPYAPVAIGYGNNPNASVGGLVFDLKDARGNQFSFGKNAQEVNGSYSTSGSGTTSNVSAWMLDKMTSANRSDVINFTYQSNNETYPAEPSDHWTITDMLNEFGDDYSYVYSDELGGNNNIPPLFYSQAAYQPNVSGNQTDYVNGFSGSENLQQITFSNGKVVFELNNVARQDFGQSNTDKALKSVKVYSTQNGTDQLLRSVSFYYSYFIKDSDASTKRLRLDSLQISDANSVVINSYRFQYNTNVNLPAWSSRAKDYWGYYNGKAGNTTLVPHQTVPYKAYAYGVDSLSYIEIGSTDAASREPNPDYMQANMLTSIYFPTGGHTDFLYETNKYVDSVTNTVKYAGGLRMNRITSYDGSSALPLIKTYQYGANGTGVANFNLSIYTFSDKKKREHWVIDSPGPIYRVDNTATFRTFFSSPTIAIQPVDGSPVIYPFVTEYRTDGTNTLGKTEYRYTADLDRAASVPKNASKPVMISTFYARGHLLNKKMFKSVSGGYQPIEEEINTYNTTAFTPQSWLSGFLADQVLFFDGFGQDPYPYPLSSTNQFWQYTNYYRFSDDNYLTSTLKKVYDTTDSTKYTVAQQQFTYTNFTHQQPTSVVTVNSKNNTLVANSRYAADFLQGSNTNTGNAVLDTMLSRNIQTIAVEQWSTLQRPSQTTGTTSGTWSDYKLVNNAVMNGVESRLNVVTPLSNYQQAGLSAGTLQPDSRYEPLLSFNAYDSYQNMQEVQRVNGVKEVFLWGYNGTYPVAHIIGSDYTSVNAILNQTQIDAATALPNNDAAVRTLLNNLRTGLPKAQVITCTYAPLVGITSQTDAKGQVTYYEYDGLQRLINVKDTDGHVISHTDYHYNR